MGSAIGLRNDFNGPALRRLARGSKSANQARRFVALAEIYDGGSRTAAARIGGVGLQIIRDWVVRFNARGPDGLLDGKPPPVLAPGSTRLSGGCWLRLLSAARSQQSMGWSAGA